jgi:hypothetical protein
VAKKQDSPRECPNEAFAKDGKGSVKDMVLLKIWRFFCI